MHLTERWLEVREVEEETRLPLDQLVKATCEVLDVSTRDFELLLVNDGSSDSSWQVAVRIAEENPRVRGIDLRRNYGQHNALLCGLRHARHELAVTLDDDLQHPPDEIPRLLDALDELGCDVVYGAPSNLPHSWSRALLSRLTKWVLARATGIPRVAEQSPFRALRTELRDASRDFDGPDVLLDIVLSWGTTRFASIPVRFEPRRLGESGYGARQLFNMALVLITGYTTAPLRLASWIGFSLTLFGAFVLAYVVGRFFLEGSIPGFPFLASLIAIFSGAQLFALGIFGEYLARIFTRSLDRPAYVVRRETGG